MQFNLNDYETVEERLRRFWKDNPKARIMTFNRTQAADREKGLWVFETRIYLTDGDQSLDLPKATGWAFEIDGTAGANRTSALENAETSSIGRCLANLNYSGNKRASREEMAKVVAGAKPDRDWLIEAQKFVDSQDVDGLRILYTEAEASHAPDSILEQVKKLGYALKK